MKLITRLLICASLAWPLPALSAPLDKLTRRQLTAQEIEKLPEYLQQHMAKALSQASPPLNRARAIPEWEEAESIITLWPNPSLMKAYTQRTRVRILADSEADRFWWENWLRQNGIPLGAITFDIVPSDTIWVQDYGPWWILDGIGRLGIADPVYNRPRPLDDAIPSYFGSLFKVPVYSIPLVHSGGNFQVDGFGRGFSSTLIYRENPQWTSSRVNSLMKEYLGVSTYLTSPLGEKTTIEHVDTFAKLVSPDTWVVGEFPLDSPFRADVDRFLYQLGQMKSPHGQPYRVFKLPVGQFKGRLRASINSMIHNHALYFPAYGDAEDEVALKIYQEALPGYEIVPVSAEGTEWSDSIHCRSRNVAKRDGFYIFANLNPQTAPEKSTTLRAELYPGEDAYISRNPKVFLSLNGGAVQELEMTAQEPRVYQLEIPPLPAGTRAQLWIEAVSSKGARRTYPRYSKDSKLSFVVPD